MAEIVLRDYQEEAIERVYENYNNNILSNLIVLGTGLGKTVLAVFLNKRIMPGQPLLFLVDRIELAYQAYHAFKEIDPSLRVGLEMNDHHASMDDNVVVACVASIGRKGSYRIGKFKPEYFKKVIVDEAHMSVSDIFIRVLNYLQVGPDNFSKDKLLVGLTATPNRTDGISLGYVYDEIAVNYDIRFGIKQGYLTDIALLQIHSGVDLSDDRFYTATDFRTDELDKAINVPDRNALVLKSYLDYSPDESAIVYTNTVDHAYQLKEIFNEHGVSSEVIEAHTKREDRKSYIHNYKAGRIKVLFNYSTLTTGFNAPETSTIILARPIRSELLLRQIIGRGVRPSEYAFIDYINGAEGRRKAIQNSIKPFCKVIDIHDSVGDHNIVSVPTLFGLHPELVTNETPKKFFEEVVEPLEEIRRERKIDISEITDLNDIEMLVEHKKLNVLSLQTPQEIAIHSDKDWVSVGEESYEIFYPQDNATLSIRRNSVGKYEVFLHYKGSDNDRKLNEFFDLSGAVQLADRFAEERFKTDWVEDKPWKLKGVSFGQMNLLKRMYRGRIGVSKNDTYEDTGVPKLYDRQLKEPILNAGHASRLINEKRRK